ncbi:MAG: hypothetical protein JST33_10970 [Actinobacteria bacterium]|nr:hypothetical protein [Actinomycetota bacterium]
MDEVLLTASRLALLVTGVGGALVVLASGIRRRIGRGWIPSLAAIAMLLLFAYSAPAEASILITSLMLVPWFVGFPLLAATFPDGRFVPRWSAGLVIVSVLAILANASTGDAWRQGSWWVLFPIAQTVAAVLVIVYRYRRSATTSERESVRWALLGVVLTVSLFMAILLIDGYIGGTGKGQELSAAKANAAGIPLMLGIVIGLTWPRLVNVDAAFRGVLVVVFSGFAMFGVFSAGDAIRPGAGVVVLALLAYPIVRIAVRAATWLVYRTRLDAASAVARLAVQLDADDPRPVSLRVAAVAAEAIGSLSVRIDAVSERDAGVFGAVVGGADGGGFEVRDGAIPDEADTRPAPGDPLRSRVSGETLARAENARSGGSDPRIPPPEREISSRSGTAARAGSTAAAGSGGAAGDRVARDAGIGTARGSGSFPIAFRGELLATLDVAPRPGESELSVADRRVLAALARHAAPALDGVRALQEARDAQRALVTAREEERRRLRRELHDDLGPALSGLALGAAALAKRAARTDAALAEAAAELQVDISDAVERSRQISHGLRPPVLDDRGLASALRDRLGDARDVLLEIGDLGALPAAVDLAALRIVQEAVTNARRHAAADECRVRVHKDGSGLRVEVVDDGVGIPRVVAAGMGLRSIRERAAELGGRARVGRGRDGGTVVQVWLPLNDDAVTTGEGAAHGAAAEPSPLPPTHEVGATVVDAAVAGMREAAP